MENVLKHPEEVTIRINGAYPREGGGTCRKRCGKKKQKHCSPAREGNGAKKARKSHKEKSPEKAREKVRPVADGKGEKIRRSQ